MKMFKLFTSLVVLMSFCIGVSSCTGAGKLPVDVKYDIMAIGDYKTMESSRPDITFTSDGRFHGTTGCNRYFGEYTLEGNTIAIAENMGMTRMFCPESDSQERLISEQLPYIVEFTVKGDAMILITAGGQKLHCVKSAEQPVIEQESQEEAPETAVERAYNALEEK